MSFTTRPELRGTFGMASSTHWLATATAQSVLERGGNAFDAVVAGAFVLHVVEPENNGAGGDLVAIFASADGVPTVLADRAPHRPAPPSSSTGPRGSELVPGSGALAAPIPGAVDAWLLLLRDHGTWELADVLAYAIGYARDGHPAGDRLVGVIKATSGLFAEHWTSSRDVWMPGGEVPRAGDLLRLERYAATLRAQSSPRLRVTTGRLGSRRHATCGAPASSRRRSTAFVRTPHRHPAGGDHAGVLRASDLAGYSAHYEAPLTKEFRGVTVAKPGAWSQGPSMLQALGILEGFAELDPSTSGWRAPHPRGDEAGAR